MTLPWVPEAQNFERINRMPSGEAKEAPPILHSHPLFPLSNLCGSGTQENNGPYGGFESTTQSITSVLINKIRRIGQSLTRKI